jgi:hypothetical protein
MSKLEITRVNVLSCGCLVTLVSAGGGILGGAVLLLEQRLLRQGGIPSELPLGLPDWVFLVLMPIIGGVMGLLGGCLIAGLYNVAARCVGGLVIWTRDEIPS